MNAEYINPFVQGAQSTLGMISGENPQLGALSLKKAPFVMRKVCIIVDIFGDIKANVIYTMTNDDACEMVSKMMMGMPVAALDDMSASALSELGNMISGNVATNLSGKGIVVDISTPRYKIDAQADDFSFVPQGKALICIPLMFTNGSVFELDVFVDA